MRSKIVCFWGHRFGRVLGRVLGRLWDAKNLDFRIFFDVFSKSFLKRVSKRQKIAPSRPKRRRRQNFGAGLRWGEEPSWGEKERGSKILANILELRSELSAKILAN